MVGGEGERDFGKESGREGVNIERGGGWGNANSSFHVHTHSAK